MSRKKRSTKRIILPDAVYKSVKVSKLANKLMFDGKKAKAEKIIYEALEESAKKIQKEPIEIFEQALKNIAPVMEVKSRRVGGSTYQVPIEVRGERSLSLAMNWLISNSRQRKGHSMVEKLSGELLDAFNNTGASVKKKEDTHKMADSNKAFAHFRW
jgi:small subunit ribosomal protein S7